jgi:hypothetical protein
MRNICTLFTLLATSLTMTACSKPNDFMRANWDSMHYFEQETSSATEQQTGKAELKTPPAPAIRIT